MGLVMLLCLTGCGSEPSGTPPACLTSGSVTKDLSAFVAVDNDLYTLRFKPVTGVADTQSVTGVIAIDGAVQNSFMTGSSASLHFAPQDTTSVITVRFLTQCAGRAATDLLVTITPRATRPDGSVSSYGVTLSDAT